MELFQKEGEFVPDDLISGDKKGMLTRGITLAAGQGILKRGTLLARNENDLGVVFGAAEDSGAEAKNGQTGETTTETTTVETKTVETKTAAVMLPSGILTDDTDTGEDSSGENVIATEYITGVFNPDAITVEEGTDVRDYTETLRTLGIFFEEVM